MSPRARVQKRLYYKIGEACKALGIQPYVLRYWETEFPALSPSKSRSGQRVYSEKELEIIRRIKELLYDEGYTIAGAKKKLETELAAGSLGGETPAQSQSPSPAEPAPDPSSASAEPEAGGGPPHASPIPAAHPAIRPPTGNRKAAGARGGEGPGAAGGSGVTGVTGVKGTTGVERLEGEAGGPALSAAADPAPAGEEAAESLPADGSSQLDTGAAQRIQTLRTGIQRALREARAILALLDS
jgi:DNA-binding transcriptional MerR regulator